MRIRSKLILYSVSIALISVLIISVMISTISVSFGSKAIYTQVKSNLISVRELKKSQIERYFRIIEDQLQIFAKDIDTIRAIKDLKLGTTETYATYNTEINAFKDEFGFNDILFIDSKDGKVIYSAKKDVELGKSLNKSSLKDGHLSVAYKKANAMKDNKTIIITDYARHGPSTANLISFMATPVFDQFKKRIGVVIFELPSQILNDIMTNNSNWKQIGLGDSGETYIVGSDHKLRTNSRPFLESPTVYINDMKRQRMDEKLLQEIIDKKTTVGLQTVNTVGVDAAIKGTSGFGSYVDYRGKKVLAAFAPLQANNLKWVIISEMDAAEAYAPIVSLKYKILSYTVWIILGVLAITTILGIWLSLKIGSPIEQYSHIIRMIAKRKDLTKRIPVLTKDELGEMAEALNQLIASFQSTCKNTLSSTDSVNDAIEQLHSIAQKINDNGNVDAGVAYEHGTAIDETGERLAELSSRLEGLAGQFKIFEKESDRVSGW